MSSNNISELNTLLSKELEGAVIDNSKVSEQTNNLVVTYQRHKYTLTLSDEFIKNADLLPVAASFIADTLKKAGNTNLNSHKLTISKAHSSLEFSDGSSPRPIRLPLHQKQSAPDRRSANKTGNSETETIVKDFHKTLHALQKSIQSMESEKVTEIFGNCASSLYPASEFTDIANGSKMEKVWSVKDKSGKELEVKESATRSHTLHDLQKQLETKIANLKDGEEKTFLQSKLTKVNELLEKGETWASSNYFRDILEDTSSAFLTKQPDQSKKSFVESWDVKTLIDTQQKIQDNYTPANINSYRQTIELDGKEPISFMRTGVMSDMSNGFFSASELQNFITGFKSSSFPQPVQEKIRTLINELKEAIKNGDPKAASLCFYSLSLLGYSNDQLQEIKTDILENNLKNPLKPSNLESVSEKLRTELAKRELFLEQQFLQLLTEQLREATPQDLKEGTFNLAHIALLDPKKSHWKKGWRHDELNEAKDMQFIFGKCKGKQIAFEDKIEAPYIDKEGKIHFPKSFLKKEAADAAQEITLETHFANISVQGDRKKNADLTKNASIRDTKTDYTTALTLFNEWQKKGYKISIGCLSAKDRTGNLAILILDLFLKDACNASLSSRRHVLNDQFTSETTINKKILWYTTKIYHLNTTELGIPEDMQNSFYHMIRFTSFVSNGIWNNLSSKAEV